MKKLYTILAILIVSAGAVGLALVYLPWKVSVAHKLQAALESKGFENVHLTLEDIGFYGATLKDITLGHAESPLTLRNVNIEYTPRALWEGYLQAIKLSGISLEIRKQDGKWRVQGLAGNGGQSAMFKLPVAQNDIRAIPFDRMTLDDSQLRVIGTQWQMTAPLSLVWQKTPTPEILLRSENPEMKIGNISARAAKGDVGIKPINDEIWAGLWNLNDVQIVTGAAEFPVAQGVGTLKVTADTLLLEGELKTPDSLYRAAFKMDYQFSAPMKADLIIDQASMPWRGGKLLIENATIPLRDRKDVQLTLQVQQVSIGQLMEAMTGERVTATGIVSGNLPITIGQDGSMTLRDGALKAAGPGVISMPPDIIPGDNKQVAVTREILKNFHYHGLSVAVHGNDKDGIALLLTLEGNNPDMYDGRPVKLNVRVAGDVLDFIRQNAMFITDPKSLLRQDEK